MIKIALDAMGGDHAPEATVKGAQLAIQSFNDIEICLFGDQEQIRPYLSNEDRITIRHTNEKIQSDDEPVMAVRRKKEASMVMAANAVKNQEFDALISAGNTGALLACGLLVVGRIKHIDRPGLMPLIPTGRADQPYLILMDAGANADCKPLNLHQFATLANYYAKTVMKIDQPRIGLINNGTEANKGNDLTKAAFGLLEADNELNFVGNVEAKSLLNGQIDITVADGFTGNAVLKTLEGTAKMIFSAIKEQVMQSGPLTKLGALLMKPSLKQLKDKFDDTKAGGAVLLGVKAPVIKAHGSSNEIAIFNAIRQARQVVESGFTEEVVQHFENKALE
ncbi:phosphate acyltransferase PlsX [Vaginisenegalia massiliensis]|uniref:phosphate acyltransferase PlsX n=1 Tax=Vaginisenegalia massiliensis TaxID=2058294 RepID=UPI000F53E795|nr:phosphate acyltransferase PlsX [Vaginisenegalia massiliensis]